MQPFVANTKEICQTLLNRQNSTNSVHSGNDFSVYFCISSFLNIQKQFQRILTGSNVTYNEYKVAVKIYRHQSQIETDKRVATPITFVY